MKFKDSINFDSNSQDVKISLDEELLVLLLRKLAHRGKERDLSFIKLLLKKHDIDEKHQIVKWDQSNRILSYYLAKTDEAQAYIKQFLPGEINSIFEGKAKDIRVFHTLLERAIENGAKEIVKILIQNDADPLQKNTNGQNALHVALINKKNSIAKYLIDVISEKNGLNEVDNLGNTALHIAALFTSKILERNKDTIIKILIKKGADETKQDLSGNLYKKLMLNSCASNIAQLNEIVDMKLDDEKFYTMDYNDDFLDGFSSLYKTVEFINSEFASPRSSNSNFYEQINENVLDITNKFEAYFKNRILKGSVKLLRENPSEINSKYILRPIGIILEIYKSLKVKLGTSSIHAVNHYENNALNTVTANKVAKSKSFSKPKQSSKLKSSSGSKVESAIADRSDFYRSINHENFEVLISKLEKFIEDSLIKFELFSELRDFYATNFEICDRKREYRNIIKYNKKALEVIEKYHDKLPDHIKVHSYIEDGIDFYRVINPRLALEYIDKAKKIVVPFSEQEKIILDHEFYIYLSNQDYESAESLISKFNDEDTRLKYEAKLPLANQKKPIAESQILNLPSNDTILILKQEDDLILRSEADFQKADSHDPQTIVNLIETKEHYEYTYTLPLYLCEQLNRYIVSKNWEKGLKLIRLFYEKFEEVMINHDYSHLRYLEYVFHKHNNLHQECENLLDFMNSQIDTSYGSNHYIGLIWNDRISKAVSNRSFDKIDKYYAELSHQFYTSNLAWLESIRDILDLAKKFVDAHRDNLTNSFSANELYSEKFLELENNKSEATNSSIEALDERSVLASGAEELTSTSLSLLEESHIISLELSNFNLQDSQSSDLAGKYTTLSYNSREYWQKVHEYFFQIKSQVMRASNKPLKLASWPSWVVGQDENQIVYRHQEGPDLVKIGIKFGKSYYAAISQKLVKQMSKKSVKKLEDFRDALKEGFVVLAHGKNGIKIIENKFFELKVAIEDYRLCSTKLYKNSNDEILILFNQEYTHKEIKDLATKVKHFSIENCLNWAPNSSKINYSDFSDPEDEKTSFRSFQ